MLISFFYMLLATSSLLYFFFFLNDTAPPEIYPLPLPAPFPIYWRGGMPQQPAQPPPAAWRGTVARGAHAGSAEPEESFRGRIVVPRDERNRRNGRKLAHKPGDGGQLPAAAAVHGNHQRVHPAFPCRVQHVSERIDVQCRKVPVAGRVDARALGRREDRAHRHHVATVTLPRQPRLNAARRRSRRCGHPNTARTDGQRRTADSRSPPRTAPRA